MSYLELFRLISNPWCSTNEIKQIAKCGRDTATKIRKDIQKEIKKNGKLVYSSKTIYVPTQKVIEYLGLDVTYIKEMAQYEEQQSYKNRTSNYASLSR